MPQTVPAEKGTTGTVRDTERGTTFTLSRSHADYAKRNVPTAVLTSHMPAKPAASSAPMGTRNVLICSSNTDSSLKRETLCISLS